MKPKLKLKRVYQITPELIKKLDIKGLLVDMDNTLLAWDATTIGEKSMQWIKTMKNCGVVIHVITNSGIGRTKKVMEDSKIPYIHSALKPLPFTFMRAGKLLGVPKKNICVVGDQLVTDVLGAKIAGLMSILVEPISPIEHKATRFNRFIERLLIGRDVRDTYDDK